ncbi:MAG: hypothetical protein GXO28_06600 [Methanopyri archaeon]|nr:hypothetical protein [Methanopyri archaeon]
MSSEELSLDGGSLVVDGPCRIEVLEGELETNKGARLSAGDEIVVKKGERLTVSGEGRVKLVLGKGAVYSVREPEGGMERPSDWEELAEDLAEAGGTPVCMVIGPVDSGKTTLVTFLTNELVERGLRVGIVDADVGQSDVGPPAVVSLGIAEEPVHDLGEIDMRWGYFVGSITPSGHLLQTTVGVRRMVDEAKREGVDAVLIDTSGMVHGGPARALKLHKVDAVRPSHVAILNKDGQVSHIVKMLKAYRGIDLRELTVPEAVRETETEDRRRFRVKMLRDFFEEREEVSLDLDEISVQRSFLGSGEPFEPGPEIVGVIKAVSGVDPEIIHAERCPDAIVLVVKENAGRIIGRGGRYVKEIKRVLRVREFIVVNEEELRNVLVGLCDDEGLVGLGVVEDIDFEGGEMKVTARFIREGDVRVVQMGSMKVDPETGEHEQVRITF